MRKNSTVDRQYKSTWFHLADVTASSHQKRMMLLRMNNSISNCFWLVRIFKSAITPWRGVSSNRPSSTLTVRTLSRRPSHPLQNLALHVTLLEQHLRLDLHVRRQECESSVVRVQTQLSVFQTRFQQTESLLEETCNKYAKLTKQVDQEDQFFRYVIDYSVNGYATAILPMVDNILDSRPHLQPTGRICPTPSGTS